MNITDTDIKKYIEIYLNNAMMGISFEYLFELAHRNLDKKEWLLEHIHDFSIKSFPIDVNDMIDDYTSSLLYVFFTLNSSNNMFSYVTRNFINEYVKNESEIEGVNDLSTHGEEEMLGLEEMYKYINSGENEFSTGSLILTDLHEKLFSHIEEGRFARSYRNSVAYLPQSGIELEYPDMIVSSMRKADKTFDELWELSDKIFNLELEKNLKKRLFLTKEFLDKLMIYKSELVRIHPFPDGNGRSIRGLTNLLLERAGLPPVYIKANERGKYHEAMNKAIKDGEYKTLTNFYKNKLCDSIEELVIYPFETAIEEYKTEKDLFNRNRLDGKNADRLFKYEYKLVKPKE